MLVLLLLSRAISVSNQREQVLSILKPCSISLRNILITNLRVYRIPKKEIKNKLEATELNRPDNSAQLEYCGQLEILLDNIKICLLNLLKKGKIQEAIYAIQEAEELVTDRKKKIQHIEKGGKDNILAEQRKRIQAAEEAAMKDLEGRKRQKRGPADVPNIPTIVLSLKSYNHNWHSWSLTRHTDRHCLKSNNLQQNSQSVQTVLK